MCFLPPPTSHLRTPAVTVRRLVWLSASVPAFAISPPSHIFVLSLPRISLRSSCLFLAQLLGPVHVHVRLPLPHDCVCVCVCALQGFLVGRYNINVTVFGRTSISPYTIIAECAPGFHGQDGGVRVCRCVHAVIAHYFDFVPLLTFIWNGSPATSGVLMYLRCGSTAMKAAVHSLSFFNPPPLLSLYLHLLLPLSP